MSDLKPLRKPAILLVLALVSLGMAFVPDHRGEELAGIAFFVFLVYFALGD